MSTTGENPTRPEGRSANTADQELRIVGGETTLEGRALTAAAAGAGLRVRWLDFASSEAQAAIAAQGPGSVRLPLVIVSGTRTLQRPPFSACVAALRSGERRLPAERATGPETSLSRA